MEQLSLEMPEVPKTGTYEAMVRQFIDAAKTILNYEPGETFHAHHDRWWRLMEVEEKITADLNARREALKQQAKEPLVSKSDRVRIAAEVKGIDTIRHDLHTYAEAMWIERVHEPMEKAFAALAATTSEDNRMDSSEWFFCIVSEDRAVEAYGSMTMEKLMQYALD